MFKGNCHWSVDLNFLCPLAFVPRFLDYPKLFLYDYSLFCFNSEAILIIQSLFPLHCFVLPSCSTSWRVILRNILISANSVSHANIRSCFCCVTHVDLLTALYIYPYSTDYFWTMHIVLLGHAAAPLLTSNVGYTTCASR